MTLGNYLIPSFVRSMSTHHEFIDKVPYYIKYVILTYIKSRFLIYNYALGYRVIGYRYWLPILHNITLGMC